ncbi:MAG: RNA polymerase sporulation sigma factor SigE [Clostridia bacterium]|nr:RNA polymerase sporulation sigma factor SigE [Clostridia bacterium]MBR2449316.1 RNA polymerase sporulation sigma factor SigE [Clostridia bacterium]
MIINVFSKLKKFLNKFSLSENLLRFIGGGEVLPQPYSAEEEAEMVSKLGAGEKDVRDKLVEHNLRLVVYIARRFENTGVDLDDLVSVGTIGLIKAVNSFNADKNIKLATYASRCIENEILMHLRRTVKLKSEVSFDEPLNTDWEGNELMLSDVMGTDGDVVYKKIENGVETELLGVALTKLNDREREIMELRYGLGGSEEKTQREVADMLGISQSYISRLEKRIIVRLKKEFSKMV